MNISVLLVKRFVFTSSKTISVSQDGGWMPCVLRGKLFQGAQHEENIHNCSQTKFHSQIYSSGY